MVMGSSCWMDKDDIKCRLCIGFQNSYPFQRKVKIPCVGILPEEDVVEGEEDSTKGNCQKITHNKQYM